MHLNTGSTTAKIRIGHSAAPEHQTDQTYWSLWDIYAVNWFSEFRNHNYPETIIINILGRRSYMGSRQCELSSYYKWSKHQRTGHSMMDFNVLHIRILLKNLICGTYACLSLTFHCLLWYTWSYHINYDKKPELWHHCLKGNMGWYASDHSPQTMEKIPAIGEDHPPHVLPWPANAYIQFVFF